MEAMKAHVPIGVLLASLALATSAAAAPGRYVLRHPTREHCKAHYVRKAKSVKVHGKRVRQVWCVRVKPKALTGRALTSTILTAIDGPGSFSGQPQSKQVGAVVNSREAGAGNSLAGVPVTVTIDDRTTGAVVVSFTVTSYAPRCAIVTEAVGGMWTFRGEALGTHEGCPIGTVTASAADQIEILGAFAGNAQYAASSSAWAPFT